MTILQCAGQRQQRSGTSPTKQQFIGAALSAFLLRKFGRRWDSTPVPVITVADLDPEAFKRFLMHAARSERMPSDALTERQGKGRAARYFIETAGNRPAVDRRFVQMDRCIGLRCNSVSDRRGTAWTGGAVKSGMVTEAVKLTRW